MDTGVGLKLASPLITLAPNFTKEKSEMENRIELRFNVLRKGSSKVSVYTYVL